MEQQAKERLTGGVILVVLLVLLVPELLSGPRPELPPSPVQPDQAPMRSYTMDLGASTHANSAPVAASTSVRQASEPAAPDSASPAVASAPSVVNGSPQPALRAPETPAPRTAAPPTTHPGRPRPPAPPAAAPHGASAWTVQLGTFSSRENAARLVASLKAHGFSASVSDATRNGHKLFRVRVGAERDRAGAQKLQGRLKAAGEKGGEVVRR
ncbi:MAG TPA: SPOR domain-containing protein [Steroidobacteraceae bacterium]